LQHFKTANATFFAQLPKVEGTLVYRMPRASLQV